MIQSRKAILCVDDETIVLSSTKRQLQANFGKKCILKIAEGAEVAFEVFEELTKIRFQYSI